MKVYQTIAVVAALIALMGSNTIAAPADPVESTTKSGAMLTQADKEFILTVAQCGMAEVKMGDLASQKGMREDVKAFGQTVAKDHTTMNTDLATLAMKKGVMLPTSLNAKHQEKLDKLMALTGEKFDTAFLADMHKGHTKDAKDFKAEAADTKDADIKSFVDKYLPVVNEHLEHINALKK